MVEKITLYKDNDINNYYFKKKYGKSEIYKANKHTILLYLRPYWLGRVYDQIDFKLQDAGQRDDKSSTYLNVKKTLSLIGLDQGLKIVLRRGFWLSKVKKNTSRHSPSNSK